MRTRQALTFRLEAQISDVPLIANGGDFYWCVKAQGLTPETEVEVFLHADSVEIGSYGELAFSKAGSTYGPHTVFAAGVWRCFYAAAVVNGEPVAVSSWSEA